MSEYGRLWERVRQIRAKLRDRLPMSQHRSLTETRAELIFVQAIVNEWEKLEVEMEEANDE